MRRYCCKLDGFGFQIVMLCTFLGSYAHLHVIFLYEILSISNVLLYLCFVNQLIHEIISEYGTDNINLLQEKLRKMRILENIELPDSVIELLNNTKEISVNEPVEEIDVHDNDVKATEKKEQEDDEDEVGEEEQEDDGEDPIVENTGISIERRFEVDPKLPMMVRMANLCVVGGISVNGVAEIHSEIVKQEVFNEFYKVTKPEDYFCYLLF